MGCMLRKFFLFLAFFLSGFASLLHEVVWQRRLVTLFGSTVYATSTLLFIFMAGLGIGAYLSPRFLKKFSAGRLYFLCEAGIALYALLFPVLFSLLSVLESAVPYGHPWLITLYRLFLSTMFLLPPVLLMGASYPFFCALFLKEEKLSAWGAYAYAFNTFGGAAGTLAAGFFLIKHFGLTWTQCFAAAFNIAAGLLVVAFCRHEEAQSATDEDSFFFIDAASLCAFASGALALACEVIFTRVFAGVFGSTVYAFTLILFSFLTGIFLGSFLTGHFLSFTKKKPALSIFFFTAAVSLAAAKYFTGASPYIFLKLLKQYEPTLFRYHIAQLGTALACLLFPAMSFGSIFSACLFAARRDSKTQAHVVSVYAMNSLGSSLGALLILAFVSLFGFEISLILAAMFMLIVSVILSVQEKGVAVSFSVGGGLFLSVILLLLPGWDRQILNYGIFEAGIMMLGQDENARANPDFLNNLLKTKGKMLFYYEGLHSTVTVAQEQNNVFLKINGRTNASTGRDMNTQVLLAYLPMLFHPHPENIFVLGFGSGSTLRAVLDFPVKKVDVAELEKGVVKAAPLFERANRGSYKDRRVNIILDDGRYFLRKNPSTYDVIISEPSHPWFGNNTLFTKEFYEIAYDRLNDGGVMAQWLASYGLNTEGVKTAMRTFLSVFDDVSVYNSLLGDFILVGRKKGARFSVNDIGLRIKKNNLTRTLKHLNLNDPSVFVSGTFLMDNKDLRKFVGEGQLNTDSFPVIEFAGADALLELNLSHKNYKAMSQFKTQFFPGFLAEKNKDLNPQQLFQIAIAKLIQWNSDDAIEILTRLIKLQPKAPALYHILGQAYIVGSDAKNASTTFEKEVRLKPDAAEGWYDLSLCYRLMGNAQKADEVMKKALKINPNISSPDFPFQ